MGSTSLTQTGAPANGLVGPVDFVKSPTNRLNQIELQSGAWTNASGQTLALTNDTFFRDELLQTNYYGPVDFLDGDPNTPESDYTAWVLSIEDADDTDKNGIPDFSDDPAAVGVRSPLLILSRGTTNLWLSVSGSVGRIHEVQETSSLAETNWATISSFTLTNDPQIVSLLLPTRAPGFWRMRVP